MLFQIVPCIRDTSPPAMINTTSLADVRLPSNRSQVRGDGVVNDNASVDNMSSAAVSAGSDRASVDRVLRLCDTLILAIVCVGLVGNTLAFSALSSRGCRGRRRRWRTHHALAILLQVSDLSLEQSCVKYQSIDLRFFFFFLFFLSACHYIYILYVLYK